jgi:hypothetical protein
MAEQPPLNRIYVLGYSANDRDYPIVSLNADPRVAGYQVPKDLSACPDKRYPNHVFTGAQPISGDERVRHVWEILPSPWVPFTRYDDDLGPIQGRRRSVKNEGQVASLSPSTRTTYEAREGSAIVYTELEESWSIETDEDGNSLFPIRDRDFYDASRGPVQERRQLFVPTGDEVGSLENVNGVITQTSYEPYNEFLSVKIVQTYSVDGPLLIGKATDNEGQLVTVTTQRKGAQGYNPPSPTATRTVEVSREDAESLVERVVDTPKVFSGEVRSVERPDNVPPKFRAKIPTSTTEITVSGEIETPTLSTGELAKSEQQSTEFVKRIRTTNRESSVEPEEPLSAAGNVGFLASNSQQITGAEFTSELGGGFANVIETYPFVKFADYKNIKPEFGTIADQIEDLGDGTSIRRQVKLPKSDYISGESSDFWNNGNNLFTGPSLPILSGQDYDEELDIVIPYKQVVAEPSNSALSTGERRRVTPRDVSHSVVVKYNIEDIQDSLNEYYWEIPDMISVQLPDKLISARVITDTASSSGSGSGIGDSDTFSYSFSRSSSIRGNVIYDIESGYNGNIPTIRAVFFLPKGASSPNDVREKIREKRNNSAIDFWPNARPQAHELVVLGRTSTRENSQSVSFNSGSTSESQGGSISADKTTIPPTIHGRISIFEDEDGDGIIDGGEDGLSALVSPNILEATQPYSEFPTGEFIYQINATPYKFSYTRIDVLLVSITSEYV